MEGRATTFSGEVLGLVVLARAGGVYLERNAGVDEEEERATKFSCDFFDEDGAFSVVFAEYAAEPPWLLLNMDFISE